ncbi:MAG: hypothetical protein KC501_38890 [Myxococcales bacterium]|nr:hypothetical protein [Myxococcales bacterium]
MRRSILLASALVLAGCPGDDDTAESGGSGDGTATAGTSMGSTGAGSTTAEPQTTDGGSVTGTPTPPDDGSSGGGPDPVGACTAGCMFLMGCELVDVPNCGIPCAGIAGSVAGCEAEYVAQQECVVGLSCEDAQAWSEAMMVGGTYPCADEDVAYQACIGGGGTG